MFDHNPQKPLLMLAPENPSESFEDRVLRELAAVSERLAKLEIAVAKPPLLVPPMTLGTPPLPRRPRIYDYDCAADTAQVTSHGLAPSESAMARIQTLSVSERPLCVFTDPDEWSREVNRRVGSDGLGLVALRSGGPGDLIPFGIGAIDRPCDTE